MIITSEEIREDLLLVSFEVDRVDLSLGPDLKREFLSKLEQKYPFIVVNLQKVQFMDSSGLGILVLAWQEVTKFQGKICFVSLSTSLKKLFSIAKIDQFVDIFDTLDDAKKSFDT